jgi:hypothetical protein
VGRLEAGLGAPLQAAGHDGLRGRAGSRAFAQRWRILGQDGREGGLDGVPLEWVMPRQHLVEEHSEGEDVAARVGFSSFELLRGHVGESAEHRAGSGVLRERVCLAAGGPRVEPPLRQPEVEDLRASVPGDEDILRLEVAVNDALLVSGRQPLGDPAGELEGAAQRQRSRCEAGPGASGPPAARGPGRAHPHGRPNRRPSRGGGGSARRSPGPLARSGAGARGPRPSPWAAP